MKRTPLSIGSTIQAKGGSSYTYIIDRVIGDGASSIVYEAHYVDHANHKHYIRLKECYPYQSSIERNGNNLVWSNENERTNDIAAFKSGYDALMKDQKSNYIVHAFDQFESNNGQRQAEKLLCGRDLIYRSRSVLNKLSVRCVRPVRFCRCLVDGRCRRSRRNAQRQCDAQQHAHDERQRNNLFHCCFYLSL